MHRLALCCLIVPWTICAAKAQPVGVEACDLFLDAYEHCVTTSSGVPASARAGMLQGIASMRNMYRGMAAKSPQQQKMTATMCVQASETIRPDLETYKCDIPPLPRSPMP